MSLVLDSLNGSFGYPVDFISVHVEGGGGNYFDFGLVVSDHFVGSEVSEFVVGHGGELVGYGKGERVSLVEFGYESVVFREYLESVFVFSSVGV